MTRHSKSSPTLSSDLAEPGQAARGVRSCLQDPASSARFALSPERAPSSPFYPTAPERLLTVSEAAGLLAVSEKTIRRWIAAGRLPAVRLGRLVRVSSKSLIEFVQLSEDSRYE